MDIKKLQTSVGDFFQKYKYAALIVLIGITLMLIPTQKIKTAEKTDIITSKEYEDIQIQEELETILSHIEGAGTVKVMLKELSGSETIYQTNEDVSTSDASTTTKVQIITITDAERNETGLVKQINPPKYQGAVILCQGADDPKVKLAVTDAVSKITGLGADKIAVLKMK